ncbi:hypothetical protein amb1557 [Paramagnetospirillum magneticum AMB-1]|uniref:Uncharacterized protein n=1 Tax=Paramagnetospirillum magneticum (strain ATCC 700264 / AMB-1) TaxID=342108 RepID=Q2W714_PARM1|nr:hypothetical protein amb1557 [Paramagnetospirillum magneticum AMB-1]
MPMRSLTLEATMRPSSPMKLQTRPSSAEKTSHSSWPKRVSNSMLMTAWGGAGAWGLHHAECRHGP